jgi:Tfp pilus assembly protein PilZ
MNILKAHFPSIPAFLDRYLADLTNGGAFIPTRRSVTTGEAVVVSIRLGPRGNTVLVRGTVAWRRPGKHRTKIKAGIGIEFLASEAQTRDYLLAVARGETTAMSARRHQRLPLDLPVSWQVPGARHENRGILRDIGRGGAFVMTSQLLQLETEDARCARVVECRIFAGMTDQETADALDVPLRTAQRLWAQARQRLAELIDAA